MKLLTNSRAKVIRACKRLHQIMFLLGYRPVRDSEEAAFGTLWHKALECWFKHYGQGDEQLRLARAVLWAAGQKADPFVVAKADAILLGYHLLWKDEPMDVISVEAEFRCSLVNPDTGAPSRTWELGGKTDALVKRTMLDLIVEHKTSSEDIGPGSEYTRRLRMDSQITTYFLGAAALGAKPAGAIYDVVRKPLLKPYKATPPESIKLKKDGTPYAGTRLRDEGVEEYRARVAEAIAEEPAKYYQRVEVVRLEAEMAEGQYDLWQLAKEAHEGEIAGRFPRNPDACVRFGKTCQFFDVCTGQASLEDQTLFVRSENTHPELSGETTKEEATQ